MKLEPGPGYRFLKPGERTQEGDECRDYDFAKWRRVPAGFLIHEGEGHVYRRRIEPELAYTSATEKVYYAREFSMPDKLPVGVERITATPCECNPKLWRIVHRLERGTYEMNSNMEVVKR